MRKRIESSVERGTCLSLRKACDPDVFIAARKGRGSQAARRLAIPGPFGDFVRSRQRLKSTKLQGLPRRKARLRTW
jgi:hypothetical protein